MKDTNQIQSDVNNEKVHYLLAELNSTLDLYYENIIDIDINHNEKKIIKSLE